MNLNKMLKKLTYRFLHSRKIITKNQRIKEKN